MRPATASFDQSTAVLYSDGLGDRVLGTDPVTGAPVQVLHLPADLGEAPTFEFVLRERTARLASFRSECHVPALRVCRTAGRQLAVVSQHVEGFRLSTLLGLAAERRVPVELPAAMAVTRQVLEAAVLFQDRGPDAVSGLIGPERLIITPHASVCLAEQVLCGAIEQLRCEPARLWQDFRIAALADGPSGRLTRRSDVLGIGLVMVSLLLGRPLEADEVPAAVPALLDAARERSSAGTERPLSAPVRDWIMRALQLEPSRAFASARDASRAFEQVVDADPQYLPAPTALERFLYNCTAAVLHRAVPAAAPVARAAEGFTHAAFQDQLADRVILPPQDADLQARMLPPPGESGDLPATPDGDGIDWSTLSQATGSTVTARDLSDLLAAGPDAGGPTAAPVQAESAADEEPVLFEDAPAIPSAPAQDRPWTAALATMRTFGTRRRLAVAAGLALLLAVGAVLPRVLRPAEAAAPEAPPSVASDTATPVPTADLLTAPTLEPAPGPDPAPAALASRPAAGPSAPAMEAGTSADVAVPAAPTWGWIEVRSASSLEMRAGDRPIGRTGDRVRLAAGRHQIEFVDAATGFRTLRAVEIVSGKVTQFSVNAPAQGLVHLNASPWAEVWVGTRRVGETPLANVSLPAGRHELVFRHPEFGEKRQEISLAAGATVRVSVDMR